MVFLSSVLPIASALIFIVFLAVSNWRLYQKRAELVSQFRDLEKEAVMLEKENQELQEGFFQLSDKEYLEKMAREKFSHKKPGEEVVIVLPPPVIEEIKKEERKNFWQKFLEIFQF